MEWMQEVRLRMMPAVQLQAGPEAEFAYPPVQPNPKSSGQPADHFKEEKNRESARNSGDLVAQ